MYPVRSNLNPSGVSVLSCFPLSDCFLAIDVSRFPTFFLWVTWSHRAYTVTCAYHPCPFLCILVDVLFYSNTHPHVSLLYHHFCHTCVHTLDRLSLERSIGRYLSLPHCHVLNPMRYLSRASPVLTRPRLSCSDYPCVLFRPLSSFESTDTNEHLRSPVTDHVPRFDWRRHVPSPKPPLSTFQKVPERRAQPPLPAYSHPYGTHIQKYKAQSVTTPCSRPANQLLTLSSSFIPLLSFERAENEAVVRERLSNWSLDRLKQEGYFVTGTKAYWVDLQTTARPVACFLLGPGIILPPHVFE